MIISAQVETDVSLSPRARQLRGMFDVPEGGHQTLSWMIDAPLEDRVWNIGLIVGPSGSGKSTILKTFGQPTELSWSGGSVIDDFRSDLGMRDVAEACGAVGFNTIPAWLRPFSVLSTGEQFRATMARSLLEADGLVLVDEFTSVVDRQVAKIASHAVAKYARRSGKRMIVASCHEDVIDWLQPDWIIRPDVGTFETREVSPRPKSRSRSRPASMRSGGGSVPITI
jgi:ABC-type ATPase involved in cell division